MCIPCYFDNVLCNHHHAEGVLQCLENNFKLNKSYMGDPNLYLVANMHNIQFGNGVRAWALSPDKCVHELVIKFKNYLAENLDH